MNDETPKKRRYTPVDRTSDGTAAELREWRDRMGWSQALAAAHLGIGLRPYQAMEAGDTKYRKPYRLACAMLETIKYKLGFVPTSAQQLLEE